MPRLMSFCKETSTFKKMKIVTSEEVTNTISFLFINSNTLIIRQLPEPVYCSLFSNQLYSKYWKMQNKYSVNLQQQGFYWKMIKITKNKLKKTYNIIFQNDLYVCAVRAITEVKSM